MHYPDFSTLWLNDVKDGRATTLRDSFNPVTYSATTPVPIDTLNASTALGKRIILGSWRDSKRTEHELTWTVISVNRDMALLLCDTIPASVQLYEGEIDPHAPGWWSATPSWTNTFVEKWLNLTFFPEAIDLGNRVYINPAFDDRSPNPGMATILSVEEAEAYVPAELMTCEEGSWWLRNPSDFTADAKPTYVDEQGTTCANGSAHAFRGVRPVLTVKFW